MSVLVPTSLDAARDALSANPSATVLAGGTDLMVEVNERRREVVDVIAVDRVAELRAWSHDPVSRTLTIGAAVTWSEIEDAPFLAWVPSLAQAARTVGSPQIRHAGTIGGNLGTCSPAGDGLPPLSALEAVVHLTGPGGERSLPFAEFMTGPKRNARAAGELITAVTVPVLRGPQGYAKVGVRNAMVIATAGVALVCDADAGGVRLALGSVGPVILRCPEAEAIVAAEAEPAVIRLPAVISASAEAENCSLGNDAATVFSKSRSILVFTMARAREIRFLAAGSVKSKNRATCRIDFPSR